MRLLRFAIISAVVLFLIVTAITSLLPSNVLVSRAVDARTSALSIKSNLYDLKKWQLWMSDAGGATSQLKYNSKDNILDIGGTTVSVVHVTDSSFVTHWQGKDKMISSFRIIDHRLHDSVITIQWQVEQKIKWYPWEKLASITKDDIWGGAMEKSLSNLKALVESH